MSPELMTQLVALAAGNEPITVAFNINGNFVRLEVRPASAGPAPPAGAREFSPVEEKIIAACSPDHWITTEMICEAIGESPSTEIKAVLRNLVHRGVLVSATSRGFKLRAGAPAKDDAPKGPKDAPVPATLPKRERPVPPINLNGCLA